MNSRPRHLLYITDDEQAAVLFEQALERARGDVHRQVTFQVEQAAATALVTVEHQRPDVVFLDLPLSRQHPELSTWDVLLAMSSDERTASVPVIVLALDDSESDRQRALSLRANAFLVKSARLDEFEVTLRRTLSFWLSPHVELPPSAR